MKHKERVFIILKRGIILTEELIYMPTGMTFHGGKMTNMNGCLRCEPNRFDHWW